MKKLIVFSALIALLAMTTEAFCQEVDPIEVDLDLQKNYMTPEQVNQHDHLFRDRIKHDNPLADFNIDPKEIKLSDISSTLYDPAKKALLSDSTCKSNERCITGVRIILGMENDSVVYFFQPVYLMADKVKGKDFSPLEIANAGIWRYQSGKFAHGDTTIACPMYRDHVRIKHLRRKNPYEHHLSFKDNISWKGDTKSIIYTFQEIFGIHRDAYKDDAKQNSTQLLRFHNGADEFRRYWINIFQRRRAKHLVYITAGAKGKELAIHTRSDQSAANFAHLCPPSCQKLTFKLK